MMGMNDVKKRISSPYFKVTSETEDYVVLELNQYVKFNGSPLYHTAPADTAVFWQEVLEEHGIFPVLHSFPHIICKRDK